MDDSSPLPQRFDDAIAAWAAAPEFRRKNVLASLDRWGRAAKHASQSAALCTGLAYTSVLFGLAANPHRNVPTTLGVALRDCNLNDRVQFTLDGKRSIVPVAQSIVAMLLMRDGDHQLYGADKLGPTAPLAIPRDSREASVLAAQLLTALAMASLVVQQSVKGEQP